MFCNKCGREISDDALICPHCGCGTVNYVRDQAKADARAAAPQRVQKRRNTALLLCFFLGGFGAHRFYVGKIGTGFLWLFTLGFWGVGTIVDFIMILDGKFTDAFGAALYDEATAGVSKEEYDAAAATPRLVRKIVLVAVLVIFILCILSRIVPDVIYALYD